jgi:ABC-2 type transport system ATP-binding protein
VHNPRLLFLDEPTSGVDPTARREFWELIYQLAASGVTVFTTTHYMDEAEYCNRIGLMRSGKLLAFDTPSHLKRSALRGDAWNITAPDLAGVMQALESLHGRLQASLLGDQVHLLTIQKRHSIDQLTGFLAKTGITGFAIAPGEVTLEDVFMNLTKKGEY